MYEGYLNRVVPVHASKKRTFLSSVQILLDRALSKSLFCLSQNFNGTGYGLLVWFVQTDSRFNMTAVIKSPLKDKESTQEPSLLKACSPCLVFLNGPHWLKAPGSEIFQHVLLLLPSSWRTLQSASSKSHQNSSPLVVHVPEYPFSFEN